MGKAKPFLRWAGGKQWLTPTLLSLTPKKYNTYFEPFLGGGSFFFSLKPSNAIIGDINLHLVETYEVIAIDPEKVIRILNQWDNNSDTYYKIRGKDFDNKYERAAKFIYLNKTCWNGLYRVNKQGKFNVPFSNNGRKICESEQIIEASKILQNAKLLSDDFEIILSLAKKDDFVYLDPPYTVSHSNNGFRQYNEKLFSWEDQKRLAKCASLLYKKGCFVLISNAWHEPIIKMYDDFNFLELSRHSIIAGDATRRKQISEVLFISKNINS